MRFSTGLLIFLFVWTTTAETGKKCCQSGDDVTSVDECSPSMVYDVTSQLCCQGNVREKESPDDSCCGPEVFNPKSNSKCCKYFGENAWKYNISVVPSGSTNGISCCGGVAYDQRRAKCCSVNNEFQVNDDPTGELYNCCGLKLFDVNNQICCIGPKRNGTPKTFTLLPLQGSKKACCASETTNEPYDPFTESCCGGTVLKTEKTCCADQIFDPEKEFCCYNATSSRLAVWAKNNPDDACCEQAGIYNTKLDRCCAAQIIPNGVNDPRRCCGDDGLYDPETHVCCVSRKLKIPVIVSKTSPNTECVQTGVIG